MIYIEDILEEAVKVFGPEAVNTAIADVLSQFDIEAEEEFGIEREDMTSNFDGIMEFSDETIKIWLFLIDQHGQGEYIEFSTKIGGDPSGALWGFEKDYVN